MHYTKKQNHKFTNTRVATVKNKKKKGNKEKLICRKHHSRKL